MRTGRPEFDRMPHGTVQAEPVSVAAPGAVALHVARVGEVREDPERRTLRDPDAVGDVADARAPGPPRGREATCAWFVRNVQWCAGGGSDVRSWSTCDT